MPVLSNTEVRFKIPDDNRLLFHHMHGSEELGKPFLYEITFFSEDGGLTPQDLLGQTVTVELDLPSNPVSPNNGHRYFNGYVTRMARLGRHRKYHTYTAAVRPWIWLLSRARDCRIFQDKTVPEIIKAVFQKHGLTDFEESLTVNDVMRLNRFLRDSHDFPETWLFSDFGPVAVRYYRDKNKNRRRDANEPLSGEMIHTTQVNEGESYQARGDSSKVFLFDSHGCIHIKPADRDTLIKAGAFKKGMTLAIHPYSEIFDFDKYE